MADDVSQGSAPQMEAEQTQDERAVKAEVDKEAMAQQPPSNKQPPRYTAQELDEFLSDVSRWTIFEDAEDEVHYLRRRGDVLAHGLMTARDEINRLHQAGLQLQNAYESLQKEFREVAGDVVYWQALAEARAQELSAKVARGNDASADDAFAKAPRDTQGPQAASRDAAAAHVAAGPLTANDAEVPGLERKEAWQEEAQVPANAEPASAQIVEAKPAEAEPARAEPALEPEPKEAAECKALEPREALRRAAAEAAQAEASRRKKLTEQRLLEQEQTCPPLNSTSFTEDRAGSHPDLRTARTPPRRPCSDDGSVSPCSSRMSSSMSATSSVNTSMRSARPPLKTPPSLAPANSARKWGIGSSPKRCPRLGTPSRRAQAGQGQSPYRSATSRNTTPSKQSSSSAAEAPVASSGNGRIADLVSLWERKKRSSPSASHGSAPGPPLWVASPSRPSARLPASRTGDAVMTASDERKRASDLARVIGLSPDRP